jgi:hypothetical protein
LFVIGAPMELSPDQRQMQPSPHWALMEGETWQGRPARSARTLGKLMGLGELLSLWRGPYNLDAEPIMLAAEVVDGGIIKSAVHLGERYCIKLARRIEPDPEYIALFW